MLPGMLPRSAETDAFWQAFRRHLGLDHDNYVVGSFGDTPEMATELADLVIAGIKRATASLARDYGEGREPTPKPGDFVGPSAKLAMGTMMGYRHRYNNSSAGSLSF